MIKEIAFTIYAVSDMKVSRKFYEEVLGLVPSTDFQNSDFWVEYTVGGGTFTLGCAPDQWKPSEDGACIAFEVDNFTEYVAKLKEQGIAFKIEPQEFPGCHMAVIKDPDNNNVTIHQLKQK